jgi:hypothetical protein
VREGEHRDVGRRQQPGRLGSRLVPVNVALPPSPRSLMSRWTPCRWRQPDRSNAAHRGHGHRPAPTRRGRAGRSGPRCDPFQDGIDAARTRTCMELPGGPSPRIIGAARANVSASVPRRPRSGPYGHPASGRS